MGQVKDEPHLKIITRRSDEPKLKIGETVALKDGLLGVVLARYTHSGHRDEVRYVVQVQSQEHGKRRT
jgi:hypothetical protein